MNFYTISESYNQAIMQSNPNKNLTDKPNRAYVLVILSVTNSLSIPYLLPLTSYSLVKVIHKKPHDISLSELSNSLNDLGFLRTFNMVPLPKDKTAIKEIKIDEQSYRYRELLTKQKEYIEANKADIANLATSTYRKYVFTPNETKAGTALEKYCNNFTQLEIIAKNHKEPLPLDLDTESDSATSSTASGSATSSTTLEEASTSPLKTKSRAAIRREKAKAKKTK